MHGFAAQCEVTRRPVWYTITVGYWVRDAAIGAKTIFVEVAGLTERAFRAHAAAIDVRLGAIGDFVVAYGLLANVGQANVAHAIESSIAGQTCGARQTIGAPAISGCFLSILHGVTTCRNST